MAVNADPVLDTMTLDGWNLLHGFLRSYHEMSAPSLNLNLIEHAPISYLETQSLTFLCYVTTAPKANIIPPRCHFILYLTPY